MASRNASAGETIIQIDSRTGDDSGELIAILMIVAGSLEESRRLPDLPTDASFRLVLQLQRNLFGMAERLFPEPGEMKRRVMAFADRMGFDIREHYFSAQSNATH